MRGTNKTESRYMAIWECHRMGMSRMDASAHLKFSITERVWNSALSWCYQQITLRTEFQQVYDVYIKNLELQRKALAFLDMQLSTVMMDAKKINISDIQRLFDKELEYADRLREIAGHLVSVEGSERSETIRQALEDLGSDGKGFTDVG